MLLLIKNPAGANEVLRILPGDELTLLFALNDRIADGRDVSWIWAVDWELVAPRLQRVVTAGTRAADAGAATQVCGRRRGRDARSCRTSRRRSTARAELAAGGTGYVLPTYTAMLELQRVAGRARSRPAVLGEAAA